ALDISARNRLVGIVTHISEDGVLAEVVLDLGGGNEVVSVITRSSVERLGLKVGSRAVALIKATEVMLAREA
ncbi:MAG TPA: TOBE domain-containing protein, partial [Chthonomonadaceae bacterium]|nr:TOBE domain-containing protein [Chthonomonadaceae bacterium]